jgi:hypothetical protein
MTAKKRNKPYRPRPVRLPVAKGFHDIVAMGMHTAFVTLRDAPNEDAFAQLARIFRMIDMSMEGDVKFADEQRIIDSGFAAMNQIGAKVGLIGARPYELMPVLNAINCIDRLLPRLDVMKIHLANTRVQVLESQGA